MGIAGGGQKGGRIESRGGGGTRGEKPVRQTRSALPACQWSIFPRRKEMNRSRGPGRWAALPGLGGSDVRIMVL